MPVSGTQIDTRWCRCGRRAERHRGRGTSQGNPCLGRESGVGRETGSRAAGRLPAAGDQISTRKAKQTTYFLHGSRKCSHFSEGLHLFLRTGVNLQADVVFPQQEGGGHTSNIVTLKAWCELCFRKRLARGFALPSPLSRNIEFKEGSVVLRGIRYWYILSAAEQRSC